MESPRPRRSMAGNKAPSKQKAHLTKLYQRLYDAWGPQHWWPAVTPFEVMVGAILTQNTAWKNVVKAIDNLKSAGLMSPERLHRVTRKRLAELIRPAGYYNLKTDRLKNLVKLVMDAGGGDPPRLLSRPMEQLRADLLAVKGVGPETADSIVLYAANRPIFVIDAYTRRILDRHDLADGNAPYDDLQQWFMDRLPNDPRLYNEFHALLVVLGHRHCRPKPKCGGCPLEGF